MPVSLNLIAFRGGKVWSGGWMEEYREGDKGIDNRARQFSTPEAR
jgi:hypothetical protein